VYPVFEADCGGRGNLHTRADQADPGPLARFTIMGALPAAMLADAGDLPVRARYSYEVKWDGFRAIVPTEEGSSSGAAAAGT
jgi:ATP-dependent DNA ligase